ncbi:MAG TPA: hypothetical protein VF506_20320 [Streptosporangiaceae bacterium]
MWWRLGGIAAVLACVAIASWVAFGPRAASSGNGPLFIGSYGLAGGPDNQKQPVGFIIPIISKARATIVIDRVRLIGGAGYPAPRSFALRVIAYTQCSGVWPMRRTGRGLVLDGCGAEDLGPLVGHRVHRTGHGTADRTEAVAEVRPPGPRNCWVLTRVAVRYHIGAQRFSAIYPATMVTCTGIGLTIEQNIMDRAAQEAFRNSAAD